MFAILYCSVSFARLKEIETDMDRMEENLQNKRSRGATNVMVAMEVKL